ncbi:MAG TPA: SDR family NAD(P)-dependent oxidoreductase [bacterium]|nr:SDR family NAD(P)-dependent oxidoreductase [bacterium]HQG45735.1 SDR family NAD(P)-dependent oxidoreductase [bacterium]HQJ63655.1 SDR family NAD(P)-dependent oxidoreductase [bacterium]
MNKTVLLTGASFGIGYELAKLFARDHHHLVLVARSGDKLAADAEELTRLGAASVLCLVRDLSQVESPDEIFRYVTEKELQIDILVNNAGFGDHGPFAETEWEKDAAMVQVNITSLLHLTRLFLPGMIERRSGQILNVASTAAFQPGPYMALYYASKAFVLSFSEALAEECRESGVIVTALCPGPTATEFQARAHTEGTAISGSGRGVLRMMDATAVARLGYRAMLAGKRVAVTGALNRIGAWSGRHLPRPLIMKTIKQIHRKRPLLLLALCTVLAGFRGTARAGDEPPAMLREMRGVWVATVANIDWPSRPGLPVAEQQTEALAILDRVQALKMNAVILQVRPQADALYASTLEPWSYYLTGEQGRAPEPWYDPLEFWVAQAHARGLELHAWFNPYRAGHPAMHNAFSNHSVVRRHPEWVHALADTGYYWLDPAVKGVQEHSLAVVLDVVRRYDVDGIHFDDYFYPYREYNRGGDFPDEAAWQAYRAGGGRLARDDWRRDAVNRFIEKVYKGIKKAKPWVKFGISPFGVYRPGYPEGYGGGFDQYAVLYADARLWLNRGWVDYFTPQLYWNISNLQTSYPVLLGWWQGENCKGRQLWPGLYMRPEIERRQMALEIVNQVMVTRGMLRAAPGTILFSMRSLMNADSVYFKVLAQGPFARAALMPACRWLDDRAPEPPLVQVTANDSGHHLIWQPRGKEKPFLYALYFKSAGRWRQKLFPAVVTETDLPGAGGGISALAVTAVDRVGNESKRRVIVLE